jgi:hypothetical protein
MGDPYIFYEKIKTVLNEKYRVTIDKFNIIKFNNVIEEFISKIDNQDFP